MRCCPNGQFYVVSYADGILNARNFDDFSTIHHIFSPSIVTDFAASPDGRQIYDVCDSYCTVWEPASLVTHSGIGKIHEEAFDSIASSNNSCQSLEPINALTVGYSSSRYCTGDSEGKVKVFGNDTRCTYDRTVSNLSIEHLAWSNNEKFLVIGDLGNWIRIFLLGTSEQRQPKPQVRFESPIGESIQQILVNKASTKLLVVSSGSLHLFNLAKDDAWTRFNLVNKGYKWVNHPRHESLLIGFNLEGAIVTRWDNLGKLVNFTFDSPLGKPIEGAYFPYQAASSACSPGVKAILASQFESKVLLHVYQSESHDRKHDTFHIVDCEKLVNKHSQGKRILTTRVSERLGRIIQAPVGILHGWSVALSPADVSSICIY